MSWRREGEREENQRPELIASRSSTVRIGLSMDCVVGNFEGGQKKEKKGLHDSKNRLHGFLSCRPCYRLTLRPLFMPCIPW